MITSIFTNIFLILQFILTLSLVTNLVCRLYYFIKMLYCFIFYLQNYYDLLIHHH